VQSAERVHVLAPVAVTQPVERLSQPRLRQRRREILRHLDNRIMKDDGGILVTLRQATLKRV
jgi:hypothetical protein